MEKDINKLKRRYGKYEKCARGTHWQNDPSKKRFYGGQRYWYVIYAIDMHNIKMSGFIQEQKKSPWKDAILTVYVSRAKKVALTEEGSLDFILKLQRATNPRLFLVPLKLDEIKSYIEHAQPLPYDIGEIRKTSKIEYF